MSGKSRNRHSRHPHSGPDHTATDVPPDQPTRDQIRAVLDVDAAYRQYLGEVSVQEMLDFLHNLPPETCRYLMSTLGLPAARQISRAAATQLIARLTAGGTRRQELLDSMFAPLVLACSFDLSTQQWATLLGADSAAAAHLLMESDLAMALTSTPWPHEPHGSLGKVGLLAAVDAGLPGSVAAFAFLADQDETAAEAYATLRGTFRTLPAPISPLLITPAGRAALAGFPWPEQADHMTVDEERAALAAFAAPAGSDLLSTLMREVDSGGAEVLPATLTELDARWDEVAQTLTEQGAAMAEGVLPKVADLRWAALFADVATRLARLLDAEGRQGLREALQALRDQHDLNPARAWLLRLAQMAGPSELAEEIAQVADLAMQAARLDEHDLDAALAALLNLIDLADSVAAGEVPTNVDDLFAAQQTARAGLPAYGRLIFSASTGAIVVPPPQIDEPDDAATPTPTPTPHARLAPELASSPAGPSPEPTEPVDDPGVGVAAGTEPTPDGAATGVEPAVPDPAPAPAEPATDVDDDQLAALLATSAGTLRRFSTTAPSTTPAPEQGGTPDPSDEPVVEAVPDMTPVWGQPHVASVDLQLIGAGRFGLAAYVAETTGAPQASVAARLLATYAQHVRTATGTMAAAFSEQARAVVRDELRDDRVGQLLAWAAAAKVAVLAPPAGASDTLLNLAPCIADQTALADIGEAFVEAARGGVAIVAPDAVRVSGALADAQQQMRDLSARAGDILTVSRHRTIKYIPANEVFQRWISPTGALGPSLLSVRDNDPSAAPALSRMIVEQLRGRGERSIDTVFATFTNRSVKAITAGPRRQLLERWEEVVTLCSQWVAACERVTALEEAAGSGSWQSAALARLRSRIEPRRGEAVDLLTAQEATVGVDADGGASCLLADAFAACDDGIPEGHEPTRAYAERSELLALNIPLDAHTLAPDDPARCVLDVMTLAAAPPLPADEVYTLLAERGAHDLSAALVAGVRAEDPVAGTRLDAQRNRDVPRIDQQVREEVAALRANIDLRRLAGVLADTSWSAASARAAQLADPQRRDYERIRATIRDLTGALDAERAATVQATRTKIVTAVAEHENVARHRDHLLALCDAGQVATAEEELQQALEGATVTREGAAPQHLQHFFPTVPNLLSAHSDPVGQIVRFLQDGTPQPVTSQLAAAGLDLGALSSGRADQGRRALSSWAHLASPPASGVPEQEAVAHVLRQAGLEFGAHTFDKTGTRAKRWMTLNHVRGDGKALTPVLGSGMSPGETHSLRVLIVRQAATPATVIEWMSGEAEDRTVLALWLAPKALTAAEWRAVAEASRGRKSPPVVMLDLGALVYLCAQAEPRRTTLAAIALPFTSACPYRDTHGEAAPEMFFGRTKERSQIIDMRGSSFVSGGRQLGKTTLLQHAGRRFSQLSEHHVAVYRSLYHVGKPTEGLIDPPERVWNELWPALAERGILPPDVPATDLADAVCGHIKTWLSQDDRRQLLILLDETDDFLDADSQHARFLNVGRFRDLMLDSGRRVKVVLAGLHRTARFESWPNQPLSHLGQPITVGPLRPQHAFELLTEPMAAMGFTFDSDITVARALATANNMPAQLQLLGAALFEHMSSKALGVDGPPTTITAADVEEAFDARLQALFREKFTLTLNLDPRYKVIAYVVAHIAHESGVDASLTLSDLSDECRSAWPEGFAAVSADMFRGLVNECVDLGVLAPDGTRFRLRTPTVLRLLGTDVEVFDELADASTKLAVPTASDAGAFRPRVDEHQHGSFTTRQIGALLKTTTGVSVVAGSPACGLRMVRASLEQAVHNVPGLSLAGVSAKDLTLSAAVARAAGRCWLSVDARTMSTADVSRILQVATVATAATRQPVHTIVVAGPGSAAAWATWAHRIDLARFEPQGLAMHADVNNLPFHDKERLGQLLTATGGWPLLVDKVTAAAHDPATRMDAHGLLAALEQDLHDHPGTLADAVGVSAQANPTLHAALMSAAAFTEHAGEPVDLLADLLEEDLGPRLHEAGFANARAVVQALLALGALVPDPEGRLVGEPVLLADLRRSR